MNYLDINNIAFAWTNYQMSWLELWGTLFGLVAVVLTTRESIWSWGIGIVNVLLFFVLFYQIQLYSDMFLQVYFLITNLLGWYWWLHPKTDAETNEQQQLKVSMISIQQRIYVVLFVLVGTMVLGYWISNIHLWASVYFPKPASYPYADTLVMTLSLAAQYLMTKKKIENWLLWIACDILAAYLYFQKGVLLMSIEYFIFCLIAAFGFYEWKQSMQRDSKKPIFSWGGGL